MTRHAFTLATAFPALFLLMSCSSGEADRTASRDSSATSAMVAPIPDTALERLKNEYRVLGREPAPEPQPSPDADPTNVPERLRRSLPGRILASATGEATFYAAKFEGRRTASGIPFRQNQLVAAHRGYPFGTLLRVTNLANSRTVNVRVVDRGPFGARATSGARILDLSQRAARELDFVGAGRTQVRAEVLEWGERLPGG